MNDPSFSVQPDTGPWALVLCPGGGLLLSRDGELEPVTPATAPAVLAGRTILVCHAGLTARRLETQTSGFLDILELFSFVRPARFAVPTPRGMAQALDLDMPDSPEEQALALWRTQQLLLDELGDLEGDSAARAADLAARMGKAGWRWAPLVLGALGHPAMTADDAVGALSVWRLLPEWEESAPPPAQSGDISPQAARTRLAELLGNMDGSEARPQQGDYASAVSAVFSRDGAMVLAEAGTGVGKTLGYLAPASLWASEAGAPVWLSTYTRNLQRQLEQETVRLFPDPAERAKNIVIRKGRENYLCLLNYEEAVRQSFASPQHLIALGLLARWIGATGDGDLRGGDLPGWLPDLVGRSRILTLADRRGECLHGACPHYKTCFIERQIRAARTARLVIANHALIMNALASGGVDETCPPERFVFDEGHHIFHAADSAFGSDLSGRSGYDLRRWLLGGEGRSKGRVRGLGRRAEPLLPDTETGADLLEEIRQRAVCLPAEGWLTRLESGEPRGSTERFLLAVRNLVLARADTPDSLYSLECACSELPAPVPELAESLRLDLAALSRSVKNLSRLLEQRLEREPGLEGDIRRRIASLLRTLRSYVSDQVQSWEAMLTNLPTGPQAGYVDWMGIERIEGRTVDAGLFRRHLDPTRPFIEGLQAQARGVLFTSATLTDPGADQEQGWSAAEAICGTVHLPDPALRARVPSPFNYPEQTRVLLVTDLSLKDDAAVAEAYGRLFIAAQGGALGLFTAIERLRKVRAAIAGPLAGAGLPLYSQHADGLDPHTLIDIFRAEGNACLLGTDAVRDGVDVPGRALRLIVFDRVPWPRTDLLLKARRAANGGAVYNERLTRQRLRQAFGRLIRRADDRGVFVLLSPLPSRLYSAFPGVTPERVTLEEALSITRDFLNRVDSPALTPV